MPGAGRPGSGKQRPTVTTGRAGRAVTGTQDGGYLYEVAMMPVARPLPCRYEALLRFGQAEDVPVPVVPWAPRGGRHRTDLHSHPLTSAVILANHGLLAFGVHPMDAAHLVEALEEAAGAELAATDLGGAMDFPEGALDAVRAGIRRAL